MKPKPLTFSSHPDFKPNLSPEQIIRSGAFGGGYYRDIESKVTNEVYKDPWTEFPEEWFKGLDKKYYASNTYNKNINRYKSRSGATLGKDDEFGLDYWESKNWINAQDPYGWFQWYCRFYLGRRSKDDDRQIKRWKNFCGDKGRFRVRLIKNCLLNGKKYNDFTISPIIRQGLLHWAYELTEEDFNSYPLTERNVML